MVRVVFERKDIDVAVETDDFAVIRLGSLYHHDPQSEAPAAYQIAPADAYRLPSRNGPSSPLLITSGRILLF